MDHKKPRSWRGVPKIALRQDAGRTDRNGLSDKPEHAYLWYLFIHARARAHTTAHFAVSLQRHFLIRAKRGRGMRGKH